MAVPHCNPSIAETAAYSIFHVLICTDCEPAPIPFGGWDSRSDWMKKHYEGAKHSRFVLWTETREGSRFDTDDVATSRPAGRN